MLAADPEGHGGVDEAVHGSMVRPEEVAHIGRHAYFHASASVSVCRRSPTSPRRSLRFGMRRGRRCTVGGMAEITSMCSSRGARRFLDANAAKKRGGEEVRVGRGLRQGGDVRGDATASRASADARRGQGVAGQAVRRRLRLDHRARGVRRPRPAGARTSGRTTRSRRSTRCPTRACFAIGLGMVAPTILAHASRRRKDALPARRCTAATSSAASCSASRAPAATWPACRPRPSATATSGSSPARRCGRPARSTATSARSSPAPTPTCPSTRASPGSSSTCRRPASRSGRCAR